MTENDAEIVVTENVGIYKENRGTTCGDRNYTEQNVVTETNSGVPGLHQIPFFGPLFGIKDRLNQRTELIVLITPRVVQNEGEAEKITRKLMKQYQQLIQTMDNSLELSP